MPAVLATKFVTNFSLGTTSVQQDGSRSNDDHVFITIGAIVAAVMAVLIVLMFTLILMVYRLRRR